MCKFRKLVPYWFGVQIWWLLLLFRSVAAHTDLFKRIITLLPYKKMHLQEVLSFDLNISSFILYDFSCCLKLKCIGMEYNVIF